MNVMQSLRGHPGIRDSLRNIGWLSGDRIVRLFGALLVGTLVARYLGPGQFGLLNYGTAIYGLFNIISNLGLDSLVVRDIALDAEGEPHILGTAFVLKALASVVTSVAAMIAARLLDPHNRPLIIIVALLSFASISQALDVIDYFFQAHTRSRHTVVPRTAAFIAGSVARVAAVFMGSSLLVFAWIAALEILVGELGLGISYLRYRAAVARWNWNRKLAKTLMTESWPLLIGSLMTMFYMRTDQVLLGKMSTMETVGNYTAAIRFSEIWYAIPMIATISVMPKLLKSREANPQQYYSRLETVYKAMVLISVIVTIGTLVFGPWVVRHLYGAKYSSAATILSIHIWAGVFVSIGCVSGQQYVHENITSTALKRTILGAILNVGLNLVWIPRWGGIGSAMATLISYSVAAYFGDALDRKTRHIFRMKTVALFQFWRLPSRLFKRTAHEPA